MMKRNENGLSRCIVENWHQGIGTIIFRSYNFTASLPEIRCSLRLPTTEIAWREFDLITDVFLVDNCRLRMVFELKHGSIGYRSIAQVLFYKNIFIPKHKTFLQAERFIFIVVESHPSPKKWYRDSNMESDAVDFLSLFDTKAPRKNKLSISIS